MLDKLTVITIKTIRIGAKSSIYHYIGEKGWPSMD